MVDHYPIQKRKKTDTGFPILDTAFFFPLPYPRWEEEKPRNPFPRCSLILRVFHYPISEGKKRNSGLWIQKAGYLITSPQRQGRGPGEAFVKTAIEGVFCLC